MIFQLALIVVLIALILYALSQRRRVPVVARIILCGSLIGIFFVIAPEWTNYLAHWVGVGRGADLVFYVFVVLTLAAVFNLHLQIRANAEVTTELARMIALMTTRRPPRE
ncbi:DUF2304 domain-containing protein [Microvirga terrae]|uniref:DUF2304 domain-containing protein n=1 Tax=Microvirga terrae TaxID=2740529 RepID=A0ABY5RMG5_9HYPH|nr:DUF2304 domain-containing protein [Microvirga terrae]UVF18421.1 DUF2304 domain-containing protein [Microvirga terrae]